MRRAEFSFKANQKQCVRRSAVCHHERNQGKIQSKVIALWLFLRLPRAVSRIPRCFRDVAISVKRIKENLALGDPPVAARRFKDPAAF